MGDDPKRQKTLFLKDIIKAETLNTQFLPSLSVVYGIVKQHRGWIDVYSELGRGSIFKIYLPAFYGEGEDEREKTTTPSLKGLHGKGDKILLVEDEKGVREYAGKALREHGYVILEAASAEEAIDIFEKEKGDIRLLFSDVVLPDMTGIKLVDRLLSQEPEISVLLSSGYTEQKSQWPLIQERGFQFIQKPYTLANLLQAVKEALSK